MRWLLIGLLISVGALLFVAGAVVRHVWRQRRAFHSESETNKLPVEDRGDQQIADPAGSNKGD